MRALLSALACTAALLVLSGCGTSRPPSSAQRPATVYSPLSDAQAHDIAIHALGLVGTPYRYGGNTPDGGFDCSGLIAYVYRHAAGVAPPRTVARLASFGQGVGADQLRTGDLVVFGTSHAGIYVGEGRFVHAPSTGGTVRMDSLQARQNAAFRRP
jgi:cell wall-associated NlpC family hydrolase